jgi:taurine--2-oxoglutarate transaminase
MLVNVNIGHGHPHVIQAIQNQAAKMTYAYPGIATEERARLAEMLAEIAPPGLKKTFFTLGGADAIENAMKLARLSTGRQKILARFRAFHGAGFGSMSAGGDPRRLANEPGVPWVVHIHDPYAYRSPIYRGRTQDEGDAVVADLIEETVHLEGPENIAGILLESYSGTSGIMQGGEVFWKRIQEIAERYSILIILDEVMSGFGRTGKWFGINHYPFVKPDLVVLAKGITSGYVPLGAVMASEKISTYFDNHVLWGGLTYSAHALACAAGIANLEVYKDEKLIENAAKMGKVMRAQLMDLAEQHPCVGDVRGTGLLQVIEIVKNRETREPMSPFNKPLTPPMAAVAASLRQQGMSTFVRWNMVFCCPPLVVTENQVKEGVDIIDRALAAADKAYAG